jgi:hypothetical protein
LHRPDNPAQTLHRNPTFPVCQGRKPHIYNMQDATNQFRRQGTFVLSGSYKRIRTVLPKNAATYARGANPL